MVRVVEKNTLDNFNYNIRYTKGDGCILINPKNWEDNNSNIVQGYTVDGTTAMNYFTRVLKTNIDEEIFGNPLQENDLVLLTRAASRVSYLKPFKIPTGINNDKFANVHIMQVIGKFNNDIMDLYNLQVFFDKVIIERIDLEISKSIFVGNNGKTSIGKVLKVGNGGFTSKWKHRDMEVKEEDYVLVRDNVSTEIKLNGIDYLCTEDSMVVGRFKDNNFDITNMELFHDGILLEEKQEEKVMGSTLLLSPSFNMDVEDISEVYQRDRFRVINKSNKVNSIKINDVIIINRDCTNYVTFKGKKYFIINGIKDIEGKIYEQQE